MAGVYAVGGGDVDGSDTGALGGYSSVAYSGDASADGAGTYWCGDVLVSDDVTAPTVDGGGDSSLLDTNGECGYGPSSEGPRGA